MSTKDNLQTAFAGESQANRMYTAFARQADKEGYPEVAKLFRAAAEAETVHALNHFQVMGRIGTTEDNLRVAIDGETYEHNEMYPGFITEAKAENNDAATRSFRLANTVEKIHASLYGKALQNLDADGEPVTYFVCRVCGNTVENEAPDFCPVCHADKGSFKIID
jgi:rubrerythrin